LYNNRKKKKEERNASAAKKGCHPAPGAESLHNWGGGYTHTKGLLNNIGGEQRKRNENDREKRKRGLNKIKLLLGWSER